MNFRTEISLKEPLEKIKTEDCIFSIGSCFAQEISTFFTKGQIRNLNNPFGTLFHPIAIRNALKSVMENRIYTEEDLVKFNSKYISFDHHSYFDKSNINDALELINQKIREAHLFLKKSNWIIITLGTSWIYEEEKSAKIVANCHKIPQKHFSKRILTSFEISDALQDIIRLVESNRQENVKILFTVSPVRHLKDGIVENQLSKSLLLAAIHEIVQMHDCCEYLPVYEILMDDLRDYRFYKEDLIHPNSQALQYIWEKFSKVYIEENALQFIHENFSIQKALEHRFFDENSQESQDFKSRLKEKILAQQKKVKHAIFSDVLSINL